MNLLINIDPGSSKPIYRQIVDEIIAAIGDGSLKHGEKLPSTRDLGKALGISRFTVMRSFEDLVSAGYIRIATGSGAYVSAENTPDGSPSAVEQTQARVNIRPTVAMPVSPFANQVVRASTFESTFADAHPQLNFGLTAFDLLPLSRWKEVTYNAFRDMTGTAFKADEFSRSCGYEPLRQALSEYLGRTRRVRCRAEDILIFSSWQKAIDFSLRLVVNPGDSCVVETPGQVGLYRTLLAAGLTVHPVTMDSEGMSAQALASVESGVQLVVVNSARHEPTGQTMSAARRRDILTLAEAMNAYVVEIDRNHEFRYGRKAVPSLQGIDDSDRVIYAGTVADVLAPLSEIAYLVLPERLRRPGLTLKSMTDGAPSLAEQMALASFFSGGHFERQTKRTGEIYAERRAALIHALTAHFGQKVRIVEAGSGLNIIVRFDSSLNLQAIATIAREFSLPILSLDNFYPGGEIGGCSGLFSMAFGHLNPLMVRENIKILTEKLNAATPPQIIIDHYTGVSAR